MLLMRRSFPTSDSAVSFLDLEFYRHFIGYSDLLFLSSKIPQKNSWLQCALVVNEHFEMIGESFYV